MKNIDIISVPLTYGSDCDGAQYGPEKLLANNLYERVFQHHTIVSNKFVTIKSDRSNNFPNLKHLDSISDASKKTKNLVESSLNNDHFPLLIGGDHSVSIGSLAAVLSNHPETSIIWVDAHTDVNTHLTTKTGNIHGMPLATSLNLGHPRLTEVYSAFVNPQNILYIGVRSIDPPEQEIINRLGIKTITMKQLQKDGINSVLETIHAFLEERKENPVHLSFDIDVLDKALIPGTGTPVDGGMSLLDAKTLLTCLKETNYITSMDFVEFNPLLDIDHQTLEICLELLETFFH